MDWAGYRAVVAADARAAASNASPRAPSGARAEPNRWAMPVKPWYEGRKPIRPLGKSSYDGSSCRPHIILTTEVEELGDTDLFGQAAVSTDPNADQIIARLPLGSELIAGDEHEILIGERQDAARTTLLRFVLSTDPRELPARRRNTAHVLRLPLLRRPFERRRFEGPKAREGVMTYYEIAISTNGRVDLRTGQLASRQRATHRSRVSRSDVLQAMRPLAGMESASRPDWRPVAIG